MKNFKNKIQRIGTIAEKFLLLGVGSAALVASIIDPRFENMKMMVQIIGAICLVVGFTPMAWAYIKINLPTDKKK